MHCQIFLRIYIFMNIIRKIDHLDKKLFYLLYVYYKEHYALDLLLFYFISAYYELQM